MSEVKIVTTNPDGSLEVSPLPGMEVCDFCSDPHPVKDYEAVDFKLHDSPSLLTPNWSRGSWTACAECAKLIDADLWEELATRAVTVQNVPEGARESTKAFLGVIYKQLRQAMADYKANVN